MKMFALDPIDRAKRVRGAFIGSTIKLAPTGNGGFGDFEMEVICFACDGSRHIGKAAPLGRGCPVCMPSTTLTLAQRLGWLRLAAREAVDTIRATRDMMHVTDERDYDRAVRELSRTREDMHLIAKAIAMGAR